MYLFGGYNNIQNIARVHIEWIHQEIIQEPYSSNCQKSSPISLDNKRIWSLRIFHPVLSVPFRLIHFISEIKDGQRRDTAQCNSDPPNSSQSILRENSLHVSVIFKSRKRRFTTSTQGIIFPTTNPKSITKFVTIINSPWRLPDFVSAVASLAATLPAGYSAPIPTPRQNLQTVNMIIMP